MKSIQVNSKQCSREEEKGLMIILRTRSEQKRIEQDRVSSSDDPVDYLQNADQSKPMNEKTYRLPTIMR